MGGCVFVLLLLGVSTWAKEGCLPDCRCANEGGYRVLNCGSLPKEPIPDPTTPTKLTVRSSKPVLYKSDIQVLRPRGVVELDLGNSGLQALTANSLQHMPALKVIRLSNNFLSVIQITTFQYNEQLKEIYLDGNQIGTLAVGCFASLPHLERLFLQHNHLTQVPNLPDQLNIVDMSYNDIKTIPPSFLIKEKLKTMDLCNNPVKNIPEICLRHNNLTSLCLGDSDVQLQQGTGKKLRQIQNITLSAEKMPGTVLSEPNIRELEGMTTVRYLTINYYTLTTLGYLQGMSLLEILTLRYDKIKGIGEIEVITALSGKPKLQTLDLVGSADLAQLVLQHARVWEQLDALETLRVADCGLTQVHVMLLPGRKLCLDLSENPLHCDCELVNVLQHVKLEKKLKTQCHTPEQFASMMPGPSMCQENETPRLPPVLPVQNPGPVQSTDQQQTNVDWRDELEPSAQTPMTGALKDKENWVRDDHPGLDDAEQKDEKGGRPRVPHKEEGFEGESEDRKVERAFPDRPHRGPERGEEEGNDETWHEENTTQREQEQEVEEFTMKPPTEEEVATQGASEEKEEGEEDETMGGGTEEGVATEEEGDKEETLGGASEEGGGDEESEGETGETEEEESEEHEEHAQEHHMEEEDDSTAQIVIFVLVGIIIILAIVALIVFSVLYVRHRRKGHHSIHHSHVAPLKSAKSECSSEDSLLKNLKK